MWLVIGNVVEKNIMTSLTILVMKVGYIVMTDPSTGSRMNLLRMRGAAVVGVYHPLVDEKVVKILHG